MTPNQPPTSEKNMTFTNQVPTVPGFYAWSSEEQYTAEPIAVTLFIKDGRLIDAEDRCTPKELGGLWCLLLPADEIEKSFREGLEWQGNLSQTHQNNAWRVSRAYKIMKGEEV